MSSLVSDYLCLLSFPCKTATEYTGRVTVCMYVCFCACASVRSSAKKSTVFQYISVCVSSFSEENANLRVNMGFGAHPPVAKSF